MTESTTLALTAGDYDLILQPLAGGSVGRFAWRGQPVMRDAGGPDVLDSGHMPLVPYSNRIAGGCFSLGDRTVRLPLNRPLADPMNPLHGYGWLSVWQVAEAGTDHARLVHEFEAGEWPWSYRAEQHFRLTPDGLTMTMTLHNRSDSAMPAGLGFHPWFPRNDRTRYHALHAGEWRAGADNLPASLTLSDAPRDWWQGQPVGSRIVDTAYQGRSGTILVEWPDRGMALTMSPSDNLPFTVVYVPEGADYFCAEPVSHLTDAINRDGMAMLAPGETITASLVLAVAGVGAWPSASSG